MDRTATDTTATKATKMRRMQSLEEAMNLATLADDLNITVRSANMHVAMQEKVFLFTRKLLTVESKTNPKPTTTQIALAIKKEFDASYGPAWHCMVGKSFGSFTRWILVFFHRQPLSASLQNRGPTCHAAIVTNTHKAMVLNQDTS